MSRLPGFNRGQGGFSLVEAMVGITVGLATVLIITQTMSLFQGGRNTSVSGANAQENGLFAMQLVGTDIRSTGAGYFSTSMVSSGNLYACTNACSYYGSAGGAGGCSNTGAPTSGNRIASISGNSYTGTSYQLQVPLFPVIIEPQPSGGGVLNGIQYAPGSDIVTVRDASRFLGAVPAVLSSNLDMSVSPATPVPVSRSFGFATGDVSLIVDSNNNCTVFEVTGVDATARQLPHAQSTFNPATFNWPDPAVSHCGNCGKTFGSGAMVYNLGVHDTNGPVVAREYSLSGPNGTGMQMRTYGVADPNASGALAPVLTMVDGIVAFKAQYGLATDATNPVTASCPTTATVTAWVGTDHAAWGTYWAPGVLDAAHSACIRAVRILVVARSANREATAVTTACATTGYVSGPCPSGGTSEPATSTLPAINLAGLPWATNGEWRHYRYKIYTTVVPIRNILWNGNWNYIGGTYTGQ